MPHRTARDAHLPRVGRGGVEQLEGAPLKFAPDANGRAVDAGVSDVERAAVDREPAGRRVAKEVRLEARQVLVDERERVGKEDDVGVEQHRLKPIAARRPT